MATKVTPLLCELSARTTWSDGTSSPRTLCDLFGRAGFDVLVISDRATDGGRLDGRSFDSYLAEVIEEGKRARRLYDLLVIPGLELAWDDPDPNRSAHALAVGLRRFVSVADGIEAALLAARGYGAALVAAHPSSADDVAEGPERTAAFSADPSRWAALVDRFELFSGDRMFPWVAALGLPVVASGGGVAPGPHGCWQTLLPCARSERAVVDYLRSPRPAFLAPLGLVRERLLQVA